MNPRPVTAGTSQPSYSLYLPFSYGAVHQMDHFGNATDGWAEFRVLGKRARIEVDPHLAILRVFDFDTEQEAEAAYKKIANGFLRAVAGARAAARLTTPLQSIDRGADPVRDLFPREYYMPWEPRTPETDGQIWPIYCYILPEHERILAAGVGLGQIVRIVTPAVINDWADDGDAAIQIQSEKVELALKLVAQANSQLVPELEYLSLVRALEVLKEDLTLGPVPTGLLQAWEAEAEKALDAAKADGDKRLEEELTDVSNRLEHASIANGIRRLTDGVPLRAIKEVPGLGMNPVADLRSQVSKLYGIRSNLVHAGEVDAKSGKTGHERLMEALPILRYLVYCVLSNRI